MIFRLIRSIFQFNGGAILQKERVDKSYQGNRQRTLGNRQRDSREPATELRGNGTENREAPRKLAVDGWHEKALTANVM